jgi:hypothetical protein
MALYRSVRARAASDLATTHESRLINRRNDKEINRCNRLHVIAREIFQLCSRPCLGTM